MLENFDAVVLTRIIMVRYTSTSSFFFIRKLQVRAARFRSTNDEILAHVTSNISSKPNKETLHAVEHFKLRKLEYFE